jgi:signal transduction histidine kinase
VSRLLLVAGALSGAVAGGLASRLGGGSAVLVGLLVGVIGAAVVGILQRRRLNAITDAVSGWASASPREPVPVTPDTDWHRLGRALNALGTEYDRVRELAAREPTARRDLVASLAAPALLFSDAGNLVAANQAAHELFQIPPSGSTAAIQTLGSAVLAAAVTEASSGRGTRQAAAEVGDRQVIVSVSPLGDEVLVIATDRTEERRVDEVRRNFVVNASHELKTPVTAIKTLTEALAIAVDEHPDKVAPLVARLAGEADRLTNLVGDLLDLRRVEDTGPIERTGVDLRALVDDVRAQLAAEAADHQVDVTVSGAVEAVVAGNRDDLGLAFRNLVSNAIRYNRPGGRVTVDLVIDADGGSLVTVEDTGIGIPRQDLPRIFERFYRVEEARSRQTGGTGLGLSIVRHIVERHGGSIGVDSLLGQGTTFTVWLPKAPKT